MRTKHRILFPISELECLYHVDRNNLPDNMELLKDGVHVAIYLTDKEFEERQGQLFPQDPLTGAFCNWDPDYEEIGELY